MAGITFTIPNAFAGVAGPTEPLSALDADFNAIQSALSGLVAALTDLPSAVNATGTRAWAQGIDIASAATLNLGSDGNAFHVTGSTGPITAISAKQAGCFILLVWDSTPTLTHNATSLALLGGANRTVAANDMSLMYSKGGGNWREVLYIPLTNSDSSHFLAGDWKWRTPSSSSGLNFAGSNTTEATTTSTTSTDLVTVSSLSIPIGTPYLAFWDARKTTGAASQSYVGYKVNSTVTKDGTALGGGNNTATVSMIRALFGVRAALYDSPAIANFATYYAAGGGATSSGVFNIYDTAADPVVTITSVTSRGNSDSALVTVAHKNFFVYTYALS